MKEFEKKDLVYIYILNLIVVLGLIIIWVTRNGLNALLYDPLQTPVEWCQNQPCIIIGDVVLNQPSSTLIVYFLAFLTIWVGSRFLYISNGQFSRLWWGLSLVLMGIGAGMAGTSYQAFGYELKCNGNAYCLWTDWWEIAYMICTVAGAGAAFVGVAYATLPVANLAFWKLYAIISAGIYVVITALATIISHRFLLSFEFMILFSVIGGFILFIQEIKHYFHKFNDELFKKIVGVWAIFILVIIVYYIALLSGFAPKLWTNGIWFNENDVLHIMMIIWILMIYKLLWNPLKDKNLS